MTIKDRILKFLDYKGISVTRAEAELGWSKSSLLKSNNVSSDKIGEFIRHYSDVSTDWLIIGKGEMIKPTNEISNNKVSANNSSNVSTVYNSGQHVNISLPENGTQKIIKPDGSVEIQNLSSGENNSLNDIYRLNQRIQDLERIISEKDATIKSKEETIWALRTLLNKQ